MVKKILLMVAVILVVIQFIRPAHNTGTATSANDITVHYTVPQDVHAILQRACFDCHSNNTYYPWYNNIQPVAWWLQHHVNEGKRHLNFSEFASYNKKRKLKKLKEIGESVTEGWMPLSSYLWIHKDAKLTNAEAKTIAVWTDSLIQYVNKTEQ